MTNTDLITLAKILEIMKISLLIIIILSSYGIYKEIGKTNDNLKMYACDGYAYDQLKAPDYCK